MKKMAGLLLLIVFLLGSALVLTAQSNTAQPHSSSATNTKAYYKKMWDYAHENVIFYRYNYSNCSRISYNATSAPNMGLYRDREILVYWLQQRKKYKELYEKATQ